MSYIRYGTELRYVVGESTDYIYEDYTGYVVDYGVISDNTIVELLAKYVYDNWRNDDKLFKDYIIQQLAKRLGVKVRKKPLTVNQQMRRTYKRVKKFAEENKWL